eukprot:2315845-Amphidinium_carterae.2
MAVAVFVALPLLCDTSQIIFKGETDRVVPARGEDELGAVRKLPKLRANFVLLVEKALHATFSP